MCNSPAKSTQRTSHCPLAALNASSAATTLSSSPRYQSLFRFCRAFCLAHVKDRLCVYVNVHLPGVLWKGVAMWCLEWASQEPDGWYTFHGGVFSGNKEKNSYLSVNIGTKNIYWPKIMHVHIFLTVIHNWTNNSYCMPLELVKKPYTHTFLKITFPSLLLG